MIIKEADKKFEGYLNHLKTQGQTDNTVEMVLASLRYFSQSGCTNAFDFKKWTDLNLQNVKEATRKKHVKTVERFLAWQNKPNTDNKQLLIDNLADNEDNISDDNTKENIIRDNNISENNIEEDIISKDIISENNTSAITKKQSFNCRRDNYLRLQTLSAFKGVTMSDLMNEAIEKFLLEHASEIQQAKEIL